MPGRDRDALWQAVFLDNVVEARGPLADLLADEGDRPAVVAGLRFALRHAIWPQWRRSSLDRYGYRWNQPVDAQGAAVIALFETLFSAYNFQASHDPVEHLGTLVLALTYQD